MDRNTATAPFAAYLGSPASKAVATARRITLAASISLRRAFKRPSATPFADAIATQHDDTKDDQPAVDFQAIVAAERARCHAIMSHGLQLGLVHAAMAVVGSDETTEEAIALLNRCSAAKDMDRADSIASGRGNIYQGSK